jgi:hypothetical protein
MECMLSIIITMLQSFMTINCSLRIHRVACVKTFLMFLPPCSVNLHMHIETALPDWSANVQLFACSESRSFRRPSLESESATCTSAITHRSLASAIHPTNNPLSHLPTSLLHPHTTSTSATQQPTTINNFINLINSSIKHHQQWLVPSKPPGKHLRLHIPSSAPFLRSLSRSWWLRIATVVVASSSASTTTRLPPPQHLHRSKANIHQ